MARKKGSSKSKYMLKKKHGLGDPGRRDRMGDPGRKTDVTNEVMKPVGIVLGLVGSAAIGHGIDYMVEKIEKKSETPPAEGEKPKFKATALIKPVVLLGGGVTGAYVFRRKHDKEEWYNVLLRNTSYGVIAGGTISTGKLILKRDLIGGGLGEPGTPDKDSEKKVLTETREEVERLLKENQFSPDLPQLPAPAANEPGADGVGRLNDILNIHEMDTIV